jgi:hypothetical protein
LPTRLGSFFKSLKGVLVLPVVFRARGQSAIPHRFQYPPKLRRVDRYAVLVVKPSDQVSQTPTHHTMDGRDRTGLDQLDQGLAMMRVKFRSCTRRLPVHKAVRPLSIKSKHPVTQYLKAHTARPGRSRTTAAVINHRKRQKPTGLFRIPALTRMRTQNLRRKIRSKSNRCCHDDTSRRK